MEIYIFGSLDLLVVIDDYGALALKSPFFSNIFTQTTHLWPKLSPGKHTVKMRILEFGYENAYRYPDEKMNKMFKLIDSLQNKGLLNHHNAFYTPLGHIEYKLRTYGERFQLPTSDLQNIQRLIKRLKDKGARLSFDRGTLAGKPIVKLFK